MSSTAIPAGSAPAPAPALEAPASPFVASPGHAAAHAAFVERLMRSVAGTFDMFTIYMGDQLGFYEALAASDRPLTPGELATRTGTQRRYVREWLEQQTVTGILVVDDPAARPEARRYSLPPAHREVLTDTESLDYLAPVAQALAGAVRPIRYVLDAYREGGGVPYGAYGAEFREGQARSNRAMFLNLIGSEWLPAVPDVHARLLAEPPARVADLGCGAGWSSIGIARSYPLARVDGYDLDEPSIELARANVAAYGLADRVRMESVDAAEVAWHGGYDLVIAFEAVHDMSDPVSVLRTMRELAGIDGAVMVVDERVGDSFTAEGSDMEWMMYGWSVLHCLPVGMADDPAVGTGTVMRTGTLRRYAREAGFGEVEVLPIDHAQFRFYRLYR
ncbi:MAG TPA: methyltransferase domain-containing protein [Gemmatimonadales bacterium]